MERLKFLLPSVTRKKMPAWPPDAFCICAAVLHLSGAYSRVVGDNPPHLRQTTSEKRETTLKTLARSWRRTAINGKAPPRTLQQWWKMLFDHGNLALSQVSKNPDCCEALLNILAVADAASTDLGFEPLLPAINETDTPLKEYENIADGLLADSKIFGSDSGSTLCKEIHPSRGRVLPKMHTAQSGLTIRSLSHNLAYCFAPDIRPQWLSACSNVDKLGFNLLVVPWPDSVFPSQFRVSRDRLGKRITSRSHGLFTFEIGRGPSVAFVRRLVKRAEEKYGHVDGIVFPELSMSEKEFNSLSRAFVNENRFLMAGIGQPAPQGMLAGKNEAIWDMKPQIGGYSFPIRSIQKKHHRWKLDKSQILQYGLSGTLHPSANWWEHINIEERTITFATLRKWLCLSMLICEDLARPDPVGDILRAVGPNLIIALLSDGPQLMKRWPGRYAGALTDDPGSSVLTITSKGMSHLSRPSSPKESRSNVIALWRDRKGTKELELSKNESGLLLNLSVEYDTEWTADGRGDGNWSGYPTLSAFHPISL
jgi:hypothetical protein